AFQLVVWIVLAARCDRDWCEFCCRLHEGNRSQRVRRSDTQLVVLACVKRERYEVGSELGERTVGGDVQGEALLLWCPFVQFGSYCGRQAWVDEAVEVLAELARVVACDGELEQACDGAVADVWPRELDRSAEEQLRVLVDQPVEAGIVGCRE